jgi:hypothetical protein
MRSADFIRLTGEKDPRSLSIASWIEAPTSIIHNKDSDATLVIDNKKLELYKPTEAKTYAIYREEPAFLASNSEGFMIQAQISVDSLSTVGAATGTGITVYDGQTVFQLQLFDDVEGKTIGLLRKGGSSSDITQHYVPTEFDWDRQRMFRFVVDPKRNIIRLYDGDDIGTAIMEVPFDRDELPNGSDFGWAAFSPFIAFGHTMEIAASGTFVLKELSFSHIYQSWDGEDTFVPDHVDTMPTFTETQTGSPTSVMDGNELVVTAPGGSTDKFHRTALFGVNRGAVLEAAVRIQSWRPSSRTGTYLILDDGVHAYALTFVEAKTGKYVAL